MSYTPTNWKAGDVVTSAKLNKMEQGIAAGGGIRVVHLTHLENESSEGETETVSPTMRLDITPNELMEAFENEKLVITFQSKKLGIGVGIISSVYLKDNIYGCTFFDTSTHLYSTDPDEYFIDIILPSDNGGDTPTLK